MKLHAGALLDHPPGHKYLQSLHFAEFCFQEPLPRASTLSRYREGLPKDFLVALRAPRIRWDSVTERVPLDDGAQWTVDAAKSLEARLIVVETHADITPGQRDRDRLRAYLGHLAHGKRFEIVWRAGGLWEVRDAQRFADSLDVIAAVQNSADPVPKRDTAYLSIAPEAGRRSVAHHDLEEIISKLTDAEVTEAFITVELKRSFPGAVLLQTAWDETQNPKPAQQQEAP